VEATFERAPSPRLIAPDSADAMREMASIHDGVSTPLLRDGDAFAAPECRVRCTIRYALDLEAVASSCHRMDCARNIGGAILGPASTFLLRPEPTGDATFRVRVGGGDPARFATGLRRDASDDYVFRARELGEASFTGFGSMRHGRLDVAGARLDIALLGAPLAMGDAAAIGWVQESAACVARLFGRFPVDATVFVVPVRGASEVVFGRVMSLAGASVALLFGDQTRAESVHDNWVVVHELFHLGCPSFVGEGRWLEEGLATYYEPILRERAGWLTEEDLWSHFAREMPRSLRSGGDPPRLEDRDDIDSTYWGGALFALLADVRIRMATGNARSLDDVVRAVLARAGDATHAARVADFLRVGDEATGTHELTAVYQSWALQGENVDLESLWKSLGVGSAHGPHDRQGAVVLRADAPQAAVRRAIAARGPY
jgi:predicted metalloprotease with PDZ domain